MSLAITARLMYTGSTSLRGDGFPLVVLLLILISSVKRSGKNGQLEHWGREHRRRLLLLLHRAKGWIDERFQPLAETGVGAEHVEDIVEVDVVDIRGGEFGRRDSGGRGGGLGLGLEPVAAPVQLPVESRHLQVLGHDVGGHGHGLQGAGQLLLLRMGCHTLEDLGVRIGRTNSFGEFVHHTRRRRRRLCDGGQCRHRLVVLLLMLVVDGADHSLLGPAGGPPEWFGRYLASFDGPDARGHLGSLVCVEVVDQDELLAGFVGLLLGRLDEAVDATVQRINLVRVDVVTAYAIFAVVTELDVVFSDFGGVGTLPDPFVAVDLVVAHGHSIVEKDGTGSGRAGRRGRLPLEDGAARLGDAVLILMTFIPLGIVEHGNDLFDAEPSRLGGSEDVMACKRAGIGGDGRIGVVRHHYEEASVDEMQQVECEMESKAYLLQECVPLAVAGRWSNVFLYS